MGSNTANTMSASDYSVTDNLSLNDAEKGILATTPGALSQSSVSKEQNDPSQAVPQRAVVDDWDSDPANPYNWPLWQRWYHAIAPALLGFAVTFGTSVYTPSVEDIIEDFKVSRTVALVGITVYTLGIGFGPIVTAPLSEGHGRRIVYLASSPIFMLFTLGAGFSKSFYSLAICRFLAGITGSPALAVGGGTNADVFPPQQRAKATSLFLIAPFAGPALGPIVGGFAAQYKGWRWTQWCLIFVTLAAFIFALPMKETYKPIILAKRAKKANLQMKQPELQNPGLKGALAKKLVRPLHMLFTEPAVFFFSIYTSFAFGVLFLFFAAFPYIFSRPPYNFTIAQSGLTFLAVGVGVLLAAATTLWADKYFYQKQHQKAHTEGRQFADPEHRLYSAMIGSGGIVVGLFWFGWTAGTGKHWAIALAGAIPFAWGNLCVFNSTVLYLADVYGPQNGASALAANGILRYTFGAVFPLFTVQMYKALGTGWATSLLGFVALFMLPIPWVFFKFGAAIRKKSKYPKII